MIDDHPHLAPWKIFEKLNPDTSRSNIFLLSWYSKTVHVFPYDLNDKSKEEEYKEKFAETDIIFSWARYWQLTDQLDIMQRFENSDDMESLVLYSDTIKEKEVKPEVKILSKVLKTAKFEIRKDHKKITKKVTTAKRVMPHEDDVLEEEGRMAKEIEMRRIAR